MIEVKIFDIASCDGYVEDALSVYNSCNFQDDNMIMEMVLNSAYFGVVYLDGEPVGVGRVISDNIRHSFIVDLNVVKEYQDKGCGKALVIELAKHANTLHVNLTTDPTNSTLPEFYRKCGFEFCEGELVFEWPKKSIV